MPNKFITNLDLARQAEIFSGETAVFKGGMQLGIPFSGFPTGVDTSTITPLTEGEGIEVQFAAFSGNTGTTVFNVTDPASPYYSVSATTLSASPYTVIDEDTINVTVSSTTYPTIMSFTAVTGSNGETLDYSFSQPVLQTLDSRGSYIGLFNFLGGVSIGTSFIDESFYNVGSVFSGANFNMEVVSLGSHGSTPAWVTGTTSGTVVEYSAMTQYWTDPTIIAYTSGLTLPITPESANTQTSDYIWTLTDSTIIDENLIGLKYTGYSVTYSFNDVAIDPESPSAVGATGATSADTYYLGTVSATFQTYSAGTLDYKGSTNWLTIDGRATVVERFTTDRMTILNPDTGSSVSTLGIGVDGKVVTYTPTITSEVTGLTFNNTTYDLSLGLDNGTSFTDNLGILASDIKVTGGTYDNATGEMTFVNNSGGSFVISGLTTGSTLQEVLDVGSTYTGSDAISMITTSTIVDRGDTSYTAFGGSSASSGRGSSYLTPTDARFRLETGIGVYSELNLTSASMLITDLVNSKGLEYGADYSSNFTNRSLVDNEYVTGITSNLAIVDTYTDGYIPRWSSTGNTLVSGTIRDNGSGGVAIGVSPSSSIGLNIQSSSFSNAAFLLLTGTDATTLKLNYGGEGGRSLHATSEANDTGTSNLDGIKITTINDGTSGTPTGNVRGINMETSILNGTRTIPNVFGIHLQNMSTDSTITANNLYQLFLGNVGNITKGTGEFYGIRQAATNVINRFSGGMRFDSIGSGTPVTNLGVDVSGNVVSGTTGGGSSPWVDTGASISYSGHGDYVEFKDNYFQISPASTSNTLGTFSNQSVYIGTGITAGSSNNVTRTLVLGINHTVAATGNVNDSIIAGNANTIRSGSNNLIVGTSLDADVVSNSWIGGNTGNNITNISDSLIFSTGLIKLTDTMVDCVILGNSSFGVKGDTVFGFGDDLYGSSTSNSEVMMIGFNVQLSNPSSKSIVIGAGQDDGQYLKIDSNYEKGIYFGVGSTKPWFALTEAQSGVGTGTSGKVGNIFFGVDITDEGGTANVGEGIMWLQESTINPSANITNAGALYNSGGTITWWDGTTNYNLTSAGGGGGSVWTASTNTATYDGNGTTETAIKLVNSSTGTGVNDGLLIGISSSNAYLINKESGSIDFRTRVASTDIDRLKILNDGTVRVIKDSGGLVISSVSTTTPASIGVYGTAGNAHFSSPTYGYTTNDGMFVGIGTGVDAHGYAWVKENLPFIIKTNNTEKLRVKGDGNVGIGFPDFNDGTAITAKLHVRGSGTTSSGSSFIVESNDGTDSFEIKDDGTIVISNVGSTTPVTNLAVDASGNVVSGTTGGGGGLNYISAGAVATNLETTSNWDINGVYTGATATGSQGDCHVDSAYWFTCVATNTWIRLIRG